MKLKEQLHENKNKVLGLGAGILTYVASGTTVIAQSSAEQGLDRAVAADNRTEAIFGQGGVFQTVVNVLLFLVGAISVIMLIVGGIRYILSAGDQNAVTSAKNTILYAIIGIIVAVLAWAIVNFLLGWLYTGDAVIG